MNDTNMLWGGSNALLFLFALSLAFRRVQLHLVGWIDSMHDQAGRFQERLKHCFTHTVTLASTTVMKLDVGRYERG